MALLIDTKRVPTGDRARFWTDESGDNFHPLQITIGANERFAGRMWGEGLGQIRLYRILAGANTMTRTGREIAAGDPQCMHLQIMLRGELRGAQRDRDVALTPGDITVYDTSQTAVFRAGAPFDLLVVQISKALLGHTANTMSKQLAVRIPGKTGLPRLATRFFVEAASGLAGGSISPSDTGVQGHVIDLVRRLYADLDEQSHPTRPHTAAELLLNAQAQIESRLSDAELCPSDIAQACFISTRYLHRVFAGEGLSVCDFIRAERLARCRRDLLDPAFGDEPIGAIAARWGLPNPSHFSRVFKDAFGCSPRAFRTSSGRAATSFGNRAQTPFAPQEPSERAAAWRRADWQRTETSYPDAPAT